MKVKLEKLAIAAAIIAVIAIMLVVLCMTFYLMLVDTVNFMVFTLSTVMIYAILKINKKADDSTKRLIHDLMLLVGAVAICGLLVVASIKVI